jgi:hypothetical protein
MSRHHMTADGPVPFAVEEETEFDARQSAYDDAYPMFKWKIAMQRTDGGMPRFLEDLISSNASLVIPAEMKKRYDDKIKIRGERP